MGDSQAITASLELKPTPATTATTSVQPAGTTPQPTGTPATEYGSLAISTSPPGAKVYADGVLRGITPATIPGLSAGTHVIVLKMDGSDDFPDNHHHYRRENR